MQKNILFVAQVALGLFLTGVNQHFVEPVPPKSGAGVVLNNHSGEAPALTIPPNIIVPKSIQPTVLRLMRGSATFRRQCESVKHSGNVRITIKVGHPVNPVPYRAHTSFERVGRQINGTVYIIIPVWCYAEIIGHEFEHIMEQLEGENLKTLSVLRSSEVFLQEDGSFETERAIRAGRQVEQEFENFAGSCQSQGTLPVNDR